MNKILVIEDDEHIALSMVIRLKAAGFEVLTAADADSAFARAVAEKPDLMLVDIAIPGGDGFSVVEKVRAEPALGAVPFIFVTASQAPGVRERGMQLGAHSVLLKPYDFADLASAIATALESENASSGDGQGAATTRGARE